jgi:Domain of unknown function (DUF1918)
MKLEVGNRIRVEAESTERPHRTGVIKEVVSEAPTPRYLVQWDDGHESIYAPAAGAVGLETPSEGPRAAAS